MEDLTIRITLTNNKGWKETKSISLERYQNQKELNIDELEIMFGSLLYEYNNVKKNLDKNKNEEIKWRP